jgi:hypothetical protein
MDKRETSKRPTPEAGGTRMFSPSFFGCANRGLRIEAPAPEEAAAPRSAGTTVDQLNGVWNSEWERSNPFGPAAMRATLARPRTHPYSNLERVFELVVAALKAKASRQDACGSKHRGVQERNEQQDRKSKRRQENKCGCPCHCCTDRQHDAQCMQSISYATCEWCGDQPNRRGER